MAPIHRAIGELRVGDPLRIEGRDLRNTAGRTLGRLSKRFDLPPGKVVSVRVTAIVHRTKEQTLEQYRPAVKVEAWETVVPEVVIDPTSRP
jgi:ATP-dependent DNA helicase RecQ